MKYMPTEDDFVALNHFEMPSEVLNAWTLAAAQAEDPSTEYMRRQDEQTKLFRRALPADVRRDHGIADDGSLR